MRQPVADVAANRHFGKGRQAVAFADVVGAGGNGVKAIGESPVEVEESGTIMQTSGRQTRNGNSWLTPTGLRVIVWDVPSHRPRAAAWSHRYPKS